MEAILYSSREHAPYCSLPYLVIKTRKQGRPWWCSGWESTCQCRGHEFDPWSGKIPHAAEQLSPCTTTTEPVHHSYWSPGALEPTYCNFWAHTLQLLKPVHSRAHVPQLLSLHAATTEARVPRACAPQQEKPPQRETHVPQWRVTPDCCN